MYTNIRIPKGATLEFLKVQIPNIESKQNSLYDLINHECNFDNPKFIRREIFHRVGKILHWLFGTADSDDIK